MLKELQIGNIKLKNNILIAPLAGWTNLPTRLIYRKFGVSLAYAEMVSSEGLHYNYKKSVKLIQTNEYDKPLGVQLFGSNSESILRAFLLIKDEDFNLIDINSGCSVKKIIKSGSGACLLQKPDEIYRIVKALKENTDKPVTIKIRSGWDHSRINFLEVYDAAYQAGINAITLHPRTKSMLFDGKADWSHIKKLKEVAKVPVIGNGDIFTVDDAKRIFEETGCDGIMLARGVLENPYLIEEIIAFFQGNNYKQRTLEERIEDIKFHSSQLIEYFGNEKKGIVEFRKFFKGYLKGFRNVSILRTKINSIITYKELSEELDKFQSTYYQEI